MGQPVRRHQPLDRIQAASLKASTRAVRVDVLAEIVKGDEVLAASPKITELKVEEDERPPNYVFFLKGPPTRSCNERSTRRGRSM